MNGYTTMAKSVNLKPDYSWVPSGLQNMVAGILGLLITVSVIVLIIGVVKFMFSKLTATLVDNPNGIKILLGVIVACVFLGSIGGLVAWGCNLFGSGGITIDF